MVPQRRHRRAPGRHEGSFVIQKELIDCMCNKLTPIDLKQHYNVKTRKAVTPTYCRTEFGSNPVWL